MTNVEHVTAATYGAAAVGKVLGRLGCGGDMHFTPAERRSYNPPVTVEIKVGDEVALRASISGFELQRIQAGPHGTRIMLSANEAG